MQLVVFSDDWGRHPSSCQHLTRQLLARHRAIWVNTIGTRPVRLSWEDAGKAWAKLRQWATPAPPAATAADGGDQAARNPPNLRVISPKMWPGFRTGWQRRLNASLISRAVNRALAQAGELADDGGDEVAGLGRAPRGGRVAITTLPITADLVGKLDVDRWVYYCVDDFSVWPGLDGSVMLDMERDLAARVDAAAAVSPNLQEHLTNLGMSDVMLLTHGIDLAHWQSAPDAASSPTAPSATALPDWWAALTPPVALFWGLIDRRLDTPCCRAIADHPAVGSLVLVGPTQSPDPALAALPKLHMPGAVDYAQLPALAAAADILVMPYADLPVTRAMQPLKFKEYLATGRPVVASKLPTTDPWSDAADIAASPAAFADAVANRCQQGVTESQQLARRRLTQESWQQKAAALESLLAKP